MSGVDIVLYSSAEKKVILQNYVNVGSQFLKTQFRNVNAVYENFTRPTLNDPK